MMKGKTAFISVRIHGFFLLKFPSDFAGKDILCFFSWPFRLRSLFRDEALSIESSEC